MEGPRSPGPARLRGERGGHAGAEQLDKRAQAARRAYELQRHGLQQRAVRGRGVPDLKALAQLWLHNAVDLRRARRA